MALRIERGFSDHERQAVARIYWQAFGGKLGWALGPEERAERFLAAVFDPSHGLVARDTDGGLVGVVGFKSDTSGFVGGGGATLRAIYGDIGSLRRALLLSVFESDPAPGVFKMEGIAVAPDARGQGVGSALLQAVITEARARRYQRVRLEVTDQNPRARALYERHGFVPTEKRTLGPLGWVLGLRKTTALEYPLDRVR